MTTNILLNIPGTGVISFPYNMQTFSHGVSLELKSNEWGVPYAVDKWEPSPLSLEFTLAVDGGKYSPSGVMNTTDLNKIVSDLYKAAIPEGDFALGRDRLVSIQIGSWYGTSGYISSIKFSHESPYDSDGVPMVVRVSLEFKPVLTRSDPKGATEYRRMYREEFSSIVRIQ